MFSGDHDDIQSVGRAKPRGSEEYHLVHFREKWREVHYFPVFIVHEEERKRSCCCLPGLLGLAAIDF